MTSKMLAWAHGVKWVGESFIVQLHFHKRNHLFIRVGN